MGGTGDIKKVRKIMKAVVYKDIGTLSFEEREKPTIKDENDVILEVTLTTICSSDIHIKKGFVPRAVKGVVLGHEFVGRVLEKGKNVKKFNIGDRVAVNCETFCGECFYCKNGYVNNCTDQNGGWALGCRIDGGQGEFVRIPFADNCLTKIPKTVTDEEALFTGDLLSTGYWACKIGEISKEDTVAVIGAGPTGLCTMMCARLFKPKKIIAIDTDDRRLELALENGYADIGINPTNVDIKSEILKCTHMQGADKVMEVAGGKNTFSMAMDIARPNAIVVLIAMYEENQILNLPQIYGKNLTIKFGGVDGIYCKEIMKNIENKKIDATPLITHRLGFDEIMRGYEIFENKKDGVIKIAIKVK